MTTSGAVYIRVKDTDQTQGNKTLDTVYIDHMYIESTGGQPDTDPPTPDPATFASPPAAVSDTEITMAATTGSDASPPVEYYFDETSGNPGGSDSGWVTNPAYNDTGLQGSTQYTYTVQMRDSLANTGTASAPANATTDPTPDTDPPTPDPATFASPPAAVSSSEIIMTATAGSDASPPVEYFFDETSGNPGGTDSGWVTDTTYNDTGLDANTTYTYTVQMRDSLANTGTASAPANATTDPPPPDTDPPTPDPATFASAPAAVSDTEITMTATTGSDASPPVEYYFDETSGNPGGDDSGWVTNPVYNDTGLDPDTTYTYTVQMRDSLANTGTASAPADATTDPAVPMTYHWKLDETSAGPVVDDEGNLDITNYGCTINQPGDPEVPGDLSYLFDSSTTDYIGTGSTTLVPQTGDWRADVTFMTTFSHPGGSPTDQGHLFGNNDGVDNNRGAMYIQDGTLHYWQKNGPSITGDSVNIADGEWHKATIERVGSTFTLYRDGQNAGSDTYSGNMGQNTEWVIGHSAPGSSNPYDFQGNISDVVLYDSTFVPEPNTVLIDYTNVTMSGALGGQGWQERIDLDSEPRALPRGWGSLGGDLLIPNSPPVPGTSYATQNGWDATYISNDELIFTFDRTYDLDSMRVWNYNKASRIDRSVQNVTIEYSTNGTDWTTLKSTTWPQGSGDTSNIGFVESLGVSAMYVKFTNMTTYGNSRIGLMGTSFFAIVGGSESDPPTPNPATFDTPPTAISQSEITMTATTGTDASPPIEYYFAETSGNPGATDSGWQTDTTYTDIGLQPLTEYTYTVQMRDNQLNTGTASAPASETTPDGPAPIDWTLITMDGGLPGQGWDERIHYDGGEDHDALVQGWMDKDGGNPLTTPHSPPLPAESTASTEHAFDAAVVSGDTLIFTLDRIYAIESMWVWNTNRSGFTSRGVNNVTIEYSTNGTSWNTLRSTSWAQAPGTAGYIGFSEDFGSNSASYVRFSSMTNHGGNRIGLSGVSFIATALPAMSFASAASNALENTGPAQIEVVLTDAPAGETYTVDYDVIGGTATGGGVDYTLANGTLTFDNNSVSEFITIDIVDDPDDEDDETIIIELSNPTGLNATLAEPTQHTYTIEDERPDVYFDLAQSKGDESVTPVNLAVSLDANATETITVDYAVVAGTATTPEDYTIATGPLTFNVGENTKNIVLNIVSDAVQEGREYIYVQLQNPVNAVLGSTIEHRYQINGNGIWWESSFWYFRWTNADRLQVNRDGDWEWDPEGDDYLMTRIADEDLSQEGQIVQRTWYWLSDGDHECPDCFDCGLYCFDDDITCIAGTSDIRLGFFQSDGVNFPTQDGYSHDTCGYRGFAWRFGPNMKSGPTRWVDCQDETHKTGMYSYVPVGQCDLLSGNENLGPGIPGFETPPGEWTTAIFKLQRFGGDIRLTIELNGRSYDWTRSDLGTSKIDIISMGMRNSRHYDRIVLSTP
ncbi:MAG: Calx-beta domain-containing protein [Planctomycetota bacterium]